MIYPYNGYSALKRNEVMIHDTLWMNFENIMLSKNNQSQNTRHYMVSFLWNIWHRQIYRKFISDCKGRRGWRSKGKWPLAGIRFLCGVLTLWRWVHNSVNIYAFRLLCWEVGPNILIYANGMAIIMHLK